ncbi:hypothetical protein NLI96_g9791 [Meripilus lineatus]|uniref:CRAL-TRIO domain-containing protein n=1 Tax=Meripilus lineatus TaxID=2056292 RepID=A0AAD5UWB0_9APHY|nr:hypothetical protein NLI96_g9791 [Physisporinus lineatus]
MTEATAAAATSTPAPEIDEVKTDAAATAKPEATKAEETTKETETPKDTPKQEIVDPEPQNALTEKFTEDEWKALKEFRTQLPAIFAEAYHPDTPDAKSEPAKLWGVLIDPYSPNKDPRVSVLLMKFLRARELDLTAAQTMMAATLKWRHEQKIDELLEETFDDSIFGKVGYVSGHDTDGRPVTYNLYGGDLDIKVVFDDVQRFIRWRIQLMEKSIALLDFQTLDQMVQVHDYEGVSMVRDANQKAAAAEATNIFQNHYPEFLVRKFFINVPTLLTWVFWLFKPLISAKTLSKFTLVGTGKPAISKELLPYIPADQLPQKYGGEAEDLA